MFTAARYVDVGYAMSNSHAVVLPEAFLPTSSPVHTTLYGESVVSAIRIGALDAGWSSQGNHDAAPFGWFATRTPSSSSSQPTSPHTPLMGRGLPEYLTVTVIAAPTGMSSPAVIRSLPPEWRNRASFAPTHETFDTDRWRERSREKSRSGSVVKSEIVATPLRRLGATR